MPWPDAVSMETGPLIKVSHQLSPSSLYGEIQVPDITSCHRFLTSLPAALSHPATERRRSSDKAEIVVDEADDLKFPSRFRPRHSSSLRRVNGIV